MNLKRLIDVERTTLALSALLIAVALVFLSRKLAFGVTIGAGLVSLNTLSLRRIAQRAARLEPGKRAGAALLMFNLKMGVLIAAIWVILRVLHVEPIAFIIGLSSFPVAIVVVAIRSALTPSSPVSSAAGTEETHG